jgi:hypothetical protein
MCRSPSHSGVADGILTCMVETFTRQRWRGWIRSSQGYSVRIVGRNQLQYLDESQRLDLFVEPLANNSDIVLDESSVPAMSSASRLEIVDRLRRAFAYAGWKLIESGSNESTDHAE